MQEGAVVHGADAGDERRKSAHDGDEAAQEDGLVAVLLIEMLRLFHVFRLDEPVPALQDTQAELLPDPVVARVAQHSGCQTDGEEVAEMQAVGRRRQGAAGEEQGIARQKRRDDEPCFAEQDQEKQEIDQGTVGRHDGRNVAVKVQHVFAEEIEELAECIHK